VISAWKGELQITNTKGMAVYGASMLGALAIILWTCFFSGLYYILIKKYVLKVSKED
jgi:hypothetical protein